MFIAKLNMAVYRSIFLRSRFKICFLDGPLSLVEILRVEGLRLMTSLVVLLLVVLSRFVVTSLVLLGGLTVSGILDF